MSYDTYYTNAVGLLQSLVSTPSFSREESNTAALIQDFFTKNKIGTNRHLNNVWCVNRHFDSARPSILLNSHHDTVKPNSNYTRDPFMPLIEDGRLFGLGSNDAGGPLVSLIAAFLYYYDKPGMQFNLVLAATAEEEISGKNGIESIWPLLPDIGFAIVGEPTLTNLAVAEKGLLVLDCVVQGRAGHAAREEGENAIYKALPDIEWFRTFRFPKVSHTLGPVKMSVTVIGTANQAHNIVPPECSFVVDVRVTDVYTHEEVLDIIKQHVQCRVTPRSMRLRSSYIDIHHPIVQSGLKLGKTTYGSPTTSDQALMPVPSLKCGPGDSARSHTADEYIYLEEISEGISTYIRLLAPVLMFPGEGV
ncbi:MAG TPA: M20 family metallo-hydrolase [Chitinophagaceae bacterium]|jgi:acetylornithine deacetylase|nr:M20 family metallo-hydrolase [Chitinophagaceae bacterium]